MRLSFNNILYCATILVGGLITQNPPSSRNSVRVEPEYHGHNPHFSLLDYAGRFFINIKTIN